MKNDLVYVRRKNLKKQQVRKEFVYSRRLLPDKRNASGPKGIVGVVVNEMAKPPLLLKQKDPRIRRHNDVSTKKSGLELVSYEQIVGKQKKSSSKVELDERTLRNWKIWMGDLDSQGIAEEADEGEIEWWEKERESLYQRVKSFISNMQLIQGEMKFSRWKGSVLDSVVGAYLTQNVSDLLSSSAFMSLAAKYPHGAARVHSPAETAKIALRSCRSEIKTDKISSTDSLMRTNSNKNKLNVVSRKRVLKGKAVLKENANDPCFKTQTNSRTKRRRCEDDAIHWDALKKYYSKCESSKRTHDNGILDALDWELVRMAKVEDIAKAIQKRGMSNNLAARIKNCLDILAKDLGGTDLEWVRDVPPHKAREYLMSIPGLGLKSVECIRLLALLQKAFPIDTNAGRVAVRLGWVPIQQLPQGQEFHLLKEYPKANSVQKYLWPRLCNLDKLTLYELHCQMITFGKVFCTKRNPNCNSCPMRAECKHYASILASSQLALSKDENKNDIHSGNHSHRDSAECSKVPIQCILPKCPQGSDDPNLQHPIEYDIEDFGRHRTSQVRDNDKNTPQQEGEVSNALMILNTEFAPVQASKLKNAAYLRAEHQIYELPDRHCVLEGLEERETADSCPYLLVTWPKENLDKDEFQYDEETIYGTLLLPVRTAMQGKFPLNGTYFQANEVFADDESCELPIKVSRASILDLPRATLYCGNNLSTICKGMKTHEVQSCFHRGYLCFRRFNRKTREPKPLSARFYFALRKNNKEKLGFEENDT
ncbi:hypothetical protein OROHE_020481 [Orobanche hederae]